MLDEVKKQLSSVKILTQLFIIAVGIYIFQNLWQVLGNFSDVIVMLISAWLISFIMEPLVEKLSKLFKMGKLAAALVVYTFFMALLSLTTFLFIPIVTKQLQSLIKLLPHYLATYPTLHKWGEIINSFLNNSLLYIPSVANVVFLIVLVFIISFYFVIDKEKINNAFLTIIPKKWHKEVHFMQQVIDSTFASFLQVQLLFGLITGLLTWIVLRIFNVDYAASSALFSGILTIIPLIGGGLGLIPPVLVSLISNPNYTIVVALLLILGQQIEFNVIGPKLLGNAMKLHPVIVILSFVIGYKIAGGAGAVFAIPTFGILFIVAHRISSHFINPEEKQS